MSNGAAKQVIYSHHFLICPWCGEESGCRVDHLYGSAPTKAGPWYCKKCRFGIDVSVRKAGDIIVSKSYLQRNFSRQMVLLRRDGDPPVFFVIDHDRYHDGEEKTEEEHQDSTRYMFEEHSCPTNWLRDCVAVIESKDTDPHGFLTFVRAVEVSGDFNADDDDQWAILFPEAFGDGPIIDHECSYKLVGDDRKGTEG